MVNDIKVVFQDIGSVLLTNGWDKNMRQNASKVFGIEFDDVNERHHLIYSLYEEGRISLDEYVDRVFFYKKRSFSRKNFKDFMFKQSKPLPYMLKFMCALKKSYGLKIIAVSNEGRELNEYRIRKFRLDRLIDVFVSSSYLHIRKPDERIYRIALDISGVSPGQAVYIDDREIFIEVAVRLGIHSILHSSYESTRRKLADMGLLLRNAR